jgi:hypothetical protein
VSAELPEASLSRRQRERAGTSVARTEDGDEIRIILDERDSARHGGEARAGAYVRWPIACRVGAVGVVQRGVRDHDGRQRRVGCRGNGDAMIPHASSVQSASL